MKFDVVGISAISGTSAKSGKPYDSYILYTSRGKASRCDAGVQTKELFVDKRFLGDLVNQVGDYTKLVGRCIDVSFDDRGFFDSAALC